MDPYLPPNERERGWTCPDCSQLNDLTKVKCSRCRRGRPQSSTDLSNSTAESPWKEAFDPTSRHLYYYNCVTGVSQWDRPAELGPAPIASGWYGRGAARGGDGGGSVLTSAHFEQQNNVFLSRPARRQKEHMDPSKTIKEVSSEYNIWYGRHIGENDKSAKRVAATDRCVLSTDAGYTKADGLMFSDASGAGSVVRKADCTGFFCLHFAHGACAKGYDCIYYHRIPTQQDDLKSDEQYDCFGRSRHSTHRDDMDGVGSFLKPCRTLYIGNITRSKYATPKKIEEVVMKHFSEWGEIERVNVVFRLSIAFVRYRFRSSAEFAKEAMYNQSLDFPRDEVLFVRWAFDDPNPQAMEAIDRADRDAVAAILMQRGVSLEAVLGLQQPGFNDSQLLLSASDAVVNSLQSEVNYEGTSEEHESPICGDSREESDELIHVKEGLLSYFQSDSFDNNTEKAVDSSEPVVKRLKTSETSLEKGEESEYTPHVSSDLSHVNKSDKEAGIAAVLVSDRITNVASLAANTDQGDNCSSNVDHGVVLG